ncbi:MAG: hypothetical protein ACXVW8_09565 [Nocardioidaceae bacterium]
MSEEWRRDIGPTVDGWLGGTYGFTDDNQFIAVVRFESKEAAMANSPRPEQGAWWRRMEALFDGPAEFHDCNDVTMMLGGGSDDAGFVQVMRGKVANADQLKALMGQTDMLHEMRPEILGATLAIEDDGTFTETIAFTDEPSARKGEQLEMPAEVRQQMEAGMRDVTFLDLHQPWFASK